MTTHRRRGRIVLASTIVVLIGLLVAASGSALAEPVQATVVATGLINPRGITFGPDGMLYVAEAGAGGHETVGEGRRAYSIGRTARVARVGADGSLETVIGELPSLSGQFDELGASDVTFLDGLLYVLTAAGGQDVGNTAWDNVVLRVDLSLSPPDVVRFFNLTRHNVENPSRSRQLDPDRTNLPGGMPFGLAALHGALYVTDGNQEHVTRVLSDGRAERIVEHSTSDRVLTGIAAGPDEALYIAEFGPLPHQEGSARVTRAGPTGGHQTVARRLVNAIDVAFDASGSMYVLEFSGPGFRTPHSGRVLRLHADGTREVVTAGLNFPTSMAFGQDGDLYIAAPGHRASNGEGSILRVGMAR
jgi:hypothetical protein